MTLANFSNASIIQSDVFIWQIIAVNLGLNNAFYEPEEIEQKFILMHSGRYNNTILKKNKF